MRDTTDTSADDQQAIEFGLHLETDVEEATAYGTIVDGQFHLTTTTDQDPYEGPASAAALQLAMLVALGPRPVIADVPALITEQPGRLDRATLLASWPADATAQTALGSAEEVVVWTAWASWTGPRGQSLMRTTTVVDGHAQGIALVNVSEAGAAIVPATSTDVWRSLAGLLPYPFELAEPADSELVAT
jgi:hypothetical protein